MKSHHTLLHTPHTHHTTPTWTQAEGPVRITAEAARMDRDFMLELHIRQKAGLAPNTRAAVNALKQYLKEQNFDILFMKQP